MKTASAKKLIVLLAAILLALLPLCGALAEDYTAQTMRLLHYEGEVEILDANGKPRFVMENARFKSGEAMRTGEESTASVSLDATKIVTLDQLSLLEFIKQGNHLLLTLKEGTLLLDVQKKLDENESLDVETSTLTVGIRGTMIVLSEQRKEDMTIAKLSVLSGVTQVTYIDEGGARQSFQLPSGSTALLTDKNGNGHADALPVIRKTEKQDMEGFVDEQLRKNPEMLKRIENENSQPDDMNVESGKEDDYPYSAGGKWQWNGKVSLVARSASKMYDGTPLVRASDVLVEGLPSEFRCSVSATGVQIDAGKSKNPVGDYKIYNSRNEDVTGHFANVEKIDGQLIVEPVPITITTGSAEKIYDGTPLTNPEVSIAIRRSVEPQSVPEEETQAGGAVGGVAAQAAVTRNVSYLVNPSLKNQTLYGVCGVVVVHAMNPLTGEASDVQLKAGYRLIIYLNDEEGRESLKYETEPVELSDLPEELLRIYAENPDALQQACQETSWKEEDVKALIANLKMNTSAKMVEQDGIRIVEDEADRLLMDFTNAHINIDSSITNYNGRALNGQEAEFVTPPIDGEITVTVTGTQTDVGESENTFEIDWDGVRKENYVVTEELGTLTVTPAALTVTTGTSEKVYDGQPLTNSEASLSGLVNGETAQVSATGSITRNGETKNTYSIAWNTAKADNYTVHESLGSLTVEPLQLSVDFFGGEVELVDGNPVFLMPVLSYGNGTHTGETMTAVRTRSLNMAYRFSLFTGDQIGLEISSRKKGGGYYDIIATPTYPAGLQASFSIDFAGTVYEGGPQELRITTPTASKTYDGTALTSTDVTVEGLDESDIIQVTATGSQTDAGSSTNTYTIDWGDTNKDDYTIVEELGTLTVEPKTVTVTTGSAEKPYDGTALTCMSPAPAINGLIDGDGATVTATGTISAVGTADNTYSIEWNEGTLAGNYAIVDDLGTLTVTPAQISITTKSASKEYDGQPLTCWELESNYTAAGDGDTFTITLENNETMTVTFQGSQTAVGTGSNTCQAAWNGDVAGNYEISWNLGSLKVTKHTSEVLLTAASATKEYDGTPLTMAEADGLPEWFSVVPTMTNASTLTEIGVCDNVIKSHKIYLDDEDVTANFTKVKYAKGTLTVTSPEIVTILASAEKTYDGTPLTPTAANTTVTMEPALEGYTAEVTMTGSLTNAGSTDASVTSFTIRKGGKDVTALFPNATAEGVLTVKKFPVKIKTGSAGPRVYNGSAVHSDDLTVNGSAPKRTDEVYCEYQLVGSDKITQMRTAGLADVGKITNECTYSLAAVANPDNYDISEEWGELEVTAQTVTVQLVNSVTTFQGPVTPDAMTAVYGDNSAVTRFQMNTESGKLTSKFRLTDNSVLTVECAGVGAGEQTYAPTCAFSKEGNDKNYTVSFTNTEVTIQPLAVTISMSCPEEIPYDGQSHGPELPTVDQPSDRCTWQSADDESGDRLLVWAWGDVFRLHLDADYDEEIAIPGTDAGEYTFSMTCGVDTEDAANYTISLPNAESTMNITPVPVTITTGDGSKVYDGTPLTQDALSVNGTALTKEDGVYTYNLVGEDVLTATVTGSVTDVTAATGNNTCDYNITGNSNNYAVTVTQGTLQIDPVSITVTLAMEEEEGEDERRYYFEGYAIEPEIVNASRTVDGAQTFLECIYNEDEDAYDFTLPYGGTLSVKSEGVYGAGNKTFTATTSVSGTSADNYNVTVSGAAIYVNPLVVRLQPGGDFWNSYEYDGRFHGDDLHVEADVEGFTPANQGGGHWIITWPWGDKLDVKISGGGIDVGSHPLSVETEFTVGNSDNYIVVVEEESIDLVIFERDLYIDTGSKDKPYDGTELTCWELDVSGSDESSSYGSVQDGKVFTVTLENGETITVTVDGSQTDVGESDNTVTIDWGSTKSTNYDVNYGYGTLEVTGITTEVVLKAGNASKPYDGTPLTSAAFTASGLPAGFTAAVTMSEDSTLTEPGTCENRIASYHIYTDGDTENDVKDWFTNVKCETGVLTVTFADTVTVDASATKPYDGTALTASSETLTISGLPEGYTVEAAVTGSQLDAGSSAVTFTSSKILKAGQDVTHLFTLETKGTLLVTARTVTLKLDGSNGDITYDGEYHGDGLEVVADGISVTSTDYGEGSWELEMPWEDTIEVNITGGDWDAGDYTLGCTWNVSSGTASNYSISATGKNMKIKPAPLTILSDSDSKEYDGTPLTCYALYVNGEYMEEETSEIYVMLKNEETITVTVTGSQTNKGESKNTYSIDWGEDAKSSNYNTTLLYGDLTVTANMSEVKITAASHSQTYDGSDVCPTDQPAWDNLPDGFYGIAESSGSQINAGSSENVVTDYTIYKASDNSVVTGNFGNIKTFNGTLTVSPKSLTVMLPEEDRTKEYDGNVFRKFVTVDGIWEETISGYITCTETAVGGPYGLTFEPDAASAETAKNYSISVTGTLTIVSSGDPPADATTDSPTTKSIKPPEPDPTNPPENDPVDPQENDPVDPQENDPVEPQENNPDDPQENDPVEPQENDPVDPQENDPVDPQENDSVDPQENDPVDPKENDPIDPQENDPIDPQENDPADPQENDPADPPEYDPEGGKGDDPETNGEDDPEGSGEGNPEGGGEDGPEGGDGTEPTPTNQTTP